MVESGQRCCSQDHTSRRKPDLEGSQEIYGATGESWNDKHPGALVAKSPPSRLVCKEFGLCHRSCNPQCLRTPPSLHSQSQCRCLIPDAQPDVGAFTLAQVLCVGWTTGNQKQRVNSGFWEPTGSGAATQASDLG